MPKSRKPRTRSLQRSLGSMVLGFESFIIFFATLVAFGFDKAHGPAIWTVGLSLAFLLILTPAFLGPRWSYYWGWLLQLAMLATAFWVPLMWIVGIIFIGLWTWGMIAGATIDKAKSVLAENGIEINVGIGSGSERNSGEEA
ncbi:MAG: DUF4233 domain-containing protein [Actinomycetales bacterium]|nr:DUF4233 domain-containing protein [Actinomycetales bacterium]